MYIPVCSWFLTHIFDFAEVIGILKVINYRLVPIEISVVLNLKQ